MTECGCCEIILCRPGDVMELSSISITDCYLKAPQEQRKITINNTKIIIINLLKKKKERAQQMLWS